MGQMSSWNELRQVHSEAPGQRLRSASHKRLVQFPGDISSVAPAEHRDGGGIQCATATLSMSPAEAAGFRIGRYRMLQKGGGREIWLAHRPRSWRTFEHEVSRSCNLHRNVRFRSGPSRIEGPRGNEAV